MKIFLFVSSIMFAVLIGGATVQAQSSFQKGDKIVNLGLGIGGLGLNATGEYLINEQIGVGAFVAYERSSYSYYYTSVLGGSYSRSQFTIGARGAFHAGEILKLDSKFDPYVAAGVGLYFYSDPYWGYNYSTNDYVSKTLVGPAFLFRIGGRYALSDKMSVFGDIGTGGSVLQAGVSFKF